MSALTSPSSLASSALQVLVSSGRKQEIKMANRSRSSVDRSGILPELSEAPGIEHFWTIQLTADKPTHTWTVKDEDLEDDDEDFFNHTLFLKQACLGESPVPDESNIVTLESADKDAEVQKGVIIHLAKGQNNMCQLDLSLNGKVGGTFTLSKGSGPVHISGNYLIEYPRPEPLDNTQTEVDESLEETEEEDLEDDPEKEEDDEEEEDEEEEEKAKTTKKQPIKRKAPPKAGKQKQKPKMEVDEDEDEEEDEEDEEDESDEEDEDYQEKKTTKKPKKAVPAKDVKDAKKGKAAVKTPEVAKKGGKKAKGKN